MNENLPTFAFEIYSIQKGICRVGWLFNKEVKTDFYVLVTNIQIDKKDIKRHYRIESPNGIRSLDLHFVKKKKIVKTLLKFFKIETLEDLSREFCSEYFDSKVKNGDMRELLIEGFNKAYGKITFSPNLNECPINLVLKLSFLRNQCGALTRSYHFNDWQ